MLLRLKRFCFGCCCVIGFDPLTLIRLQVCDPSWQVKKHLFNSRHTKYLHIYLQSYMVVSLNGGTPKTPQNDHF